jgi:hypothetical protein
MADLILLKFSPTVGESKLPWALSEISCCYDLEKAGLQETPGQISLEIIKPGLSRKIKTEIIESLSTENGLIMAELPKQMPISESQDGAGS